MYLFSRVDLFHEIMALLSENKPLPLYNDVRITKLRYL